MNNDSRIKVAEFIEDGAVVEVYEKVLDSRTYFDVLCVEVDKGVLSPNVQSIRIPSLIISLMRSMEYISDRHRDLRRGGDTSEPCKGLSFDQRNEGIVLGLAKRTEIKADSVVVEVYENSDDMCPYSVRCLREHMSQGERKTSWWIQQRDLRSLVIALSQAQKYISGRR